MSHFTVRFIFILASRLLSMGCGESSSLSLHVLMEAVSLL